MEERVAITGLGILSPLGIGRDSFAASLLAGEPCFVDEEIAGRKVRVGRVGEVVPTSVRVQSSKASQIDAVSKYAVEACAQALRESGVELDEEARDRTGVLLGTTFGCLESNTLFDQFYQSEDGRLMSVSPLLFKSTVSNAAAGWVSILLKLRGVNATFTSGVLAGAEAIAHACDLISDGSSDLILAGGGDRLIPMNLLLGAEAEAVPTEGMGVVALESMSRAVSRGARVYGRLQGYWRGPWDGQGEAGALIATAAFLRVRPGAIGSILTSASTDEGVRALSEALLSAWGCVPPLLPLKRLVGESFGAWTAQAIAAACLKLPGLPTSASSILICSTEPGVESIGMSVRRV